MYDHNDSKNNKIDLVTVSSELSPTWNLNSTQELQVYSAGCYSNQIAGSFQSNFESVPRSIHDQEIKSKTTETDNSRELYDNRSHSTWSSSKEHSDNDDTETIDSDGNNNQMAMDRTLTKKTRRGGRRIKAQKGIMPLHQAKDQEGEDKSSKLTSHIKYKNELCKNWIEKGKWPYSVRCKFAHGKHELIFNDTAEKKISNVNLFIMEASVLTDQDAYIYMMREQFLRWNFSTITKD